MKQRLALLIAVIVCVSGIGAPTAQAGRNNHVAPEDRPYYHGPAKSPYVWRAGHWEWRGHGNHKKKVWVHGFYDWMGMG